MVTPAQAIEAAAKGEERPYIDLYWDHLIDVARGVWDDPVTLYAIWSEARHRVAKNPVSKSQNAIDEIEPRLKQLIQGVFPPDPSGDAGEQGLDTDNWPKRGLLRSLGYTVGSEDPGTEHRRSLLRQAFNGPIPRVYDADYMAQWGSDNSITRLRKLAWSIASFCVARLRKQSGRDDSCTLKWREDLAWLRREYYEGYFGFPWPEIKL